MNKKITKIIVYLHYLSGGCSSSVLDR